MQIVIEIDDMTYEFVQNTSFVEDESTLFKQTNADRQKTLFLFNILDAIKNGTPLPKGHGRLIDKDHVIARLEVASKFYGGENADAFDERFSHGLKEAVIKVCEEPTIIEADKAGEEE